LQENRDTHRHPLGSRTPGVSASRRSGWTTNVGMRGSRTLSTRGERGVGPDPWRREVSEGKDSPEVDQGEARTIYLQARPIEFRTQRASSAAISVSQGTLFLRGPCPTAADPQLAEEVGGTVQLSQGSLFAVADGRLLSAMRGQSAISLHAVLR